MIVGLLETLNDQGGREDIYKLSRALHFELDDLVPITEASEILGFVRIEKGDMEFTELGRQVIDGDENVKKRIFRAQMAGVPLIGRILGELERSDDHRVGREEFVDWLAQSFSPHESERQLETALDWGRYAELFDYDSDAQEFFLPESLEAV